jgi:lipid-A-disaccharide synthase
MWPPFRDAAARALVEGRCHRVVVAVTEAGEYPGAERFSLIRGQSATVLAAADAAILKSGTSTLEAAVVGTPAVVAYRTHPLSMAVARRVVTVPWMSLVNLVAGHQVLPELVQEAVTADRLLAEVAPLLDPSSEAAARQRRELAEVRSRLGSPGAADRVAAMVDELLAA